MRLPKLVPNQFIDELKKVIWPSRKETVRLAVVVVVATIALGIYIGGLDLIFAQFLRLIAK